MGETKGQEQRTHCVRCGRCCLFAAPSLQKTDLPLFRNRLLDGKYLYTVRKGELVRDNVNGEMHFIDHEIIKIRERKGGEGCILYDPKEKACTIYAYRPGQCRALACWNDTEFRQVFSQPKAERRDILKDPSLLRLISEHENRCGYGTISHYVKQIETQGEPMVQRILKILQYDHDIRGLARDRLGLDSREMDLLFGRPLTDTIHMFGLAIAEDADGSFLLTAEEPISK